MAARVASSSRIEGASSTIFWWRRCRLHSRSPRLQTCPWVSAKTCTSMWRGRATKRSTSRVPSPKAPIASRRAAAMAPAQVGRVVDAPHALAAAARGRLEQHREPDVEGGGGQFVVVRPASSRPGTTGTPAAATARLALILSPIISMASGGGPTKTIPAAAQRRASAGFSDRKP